MDAPSASVRVQAGNGYLREAQIIEVLAQWARFRGSQLAFNFSPKPSALAFNAVT
jgi:hypothetical protein